MSKPDLSQPQQRSYATRAEASADQREVAGIGVPLGQQIEVWAGFREEFASDCVFDGIDRAKLLNGHRDVIGIIAAHDRTDTALNIVGRVSETQLGDESLTLARDGALDAFSIGFTPKEWVERDDGSVIYTRVKVREFSLTPFPAYDGALVLDVRHTEGVPTMSDTLTRDDLDRALQERQEEFDRSIDAKLAQLGPREAAPLGSQWRSAGEFLKAIASGDEAAIEFHRAYTGGTLADAAPRSTWLADAIRLVDRPRKVINLFSRETLPPEGNVLEWYELLADTTQVQKQAAEGDDLAFGKVTLKTRTSDVDTFGGYTQLTRQQIERSQAPALSTAHRALALAYARSTEAAARAFVTGVIADQVADGNVIEPAGALTALTNAQWLDLIVDGAELFEDRGFALDGMLVSKDVFKLLYRLEDGAGHNLMNVYGTGVNVSGSINVKGVTGNLANVPVRVLPGAAEGTAAFYDPSAITTFESPGAPVQLQDENIINLSKTFSVYGYASWAASFPDALVPLAAAPVEA